MSIDICFFTITGGEKIFADRGRSHQKISNANSLALAAVMYWHVYCNSFLYFAGSGTV